MAKLINNKKKNLSIITQPWFVIIVVLSCFGILTPKIFMPLFRQLTGSGRSEQQEKIAQNMRMRPMQPPPKGPPADHGAAQFGRPAPAYGQTGASSSNKSLLTFLLPVYATGIGVYMVYTLFKVFNKNKDDEKKEEDDEEEEFESGKKKNLKFLEKNLTNVRWDADEGEFKYVNKATSHFNRSEESEDELNNYERYKNLDPDYVEYLKEKRRLQREQAKLESLASTTKASIKSDEIPLSPGSGITSITNTNVLMNDTLERMKFSLNKINNQLIDVEKKGGPLDDPELENLKFQLTQTEAQMAKIMSIVNNVSSTIHGSYAKPQLREEVEENEDEDDEQEIDDLHRQVELIKQVVSTTEKCRKSKNRSKNKHVYEKIKQNIDAAEQLLRQRRKPNTELNANQDGLAKDYINEQLSEQLNTSKEFSTESSSSSSVSSASSSNQQSDLNNHETDEENHEADDDDDYTNNEEEEEDDEDDEDDDEDVESDQSSDNKVETLKPLSKDKNV